MWQILVMLFVTYLTGSWVERRHYNSIKEREKLQNSIPILTINPDKFEREIEKIKLVSGCAVVGADFFKSKLATLVSIFGGNIAALESVVDRARREAILRLKQQAGDADLICGVQYETCFMAENENAAAPTVKILAYGNAISFRKRSDSIV